MRKGSKNSRKWWGRSRAAGFEANPSTAGYGPTPIWGFRGGSGKGWGRGRRGGWGGWQNSPFNQPTPSTPSQIIPPSTDTVRIAAPVERDSGELSPLSNVSARSPYIAIATVKGGVLKEVQVLENPSANIPGGAGYSLAEWLHRNGVQVFIGPNVGPNLTQALMQFGITYIPSPPGTPLREALRYVGILNSS